VVTHGADMLLSMQYSDAGRPVGHSTTGCHNHRGDILVNPMGHNYNDSKTVLMIPIKMALFPWQNR